LNFQDIRFPKALSYLLFLQQFAKIGQIANDCVSFAIGHPSKWLRYGSIVDP